MTGRETQTLLLVALVVAVGLILPVWIVILSVIFALIGMEVRYKWRRP